MPPDKPGELPDGARRLLLGPVDSFEKLEALLALREAAGSSLPLDALAARACVPLRDIDRALSELAAAGLAERLADGTWSASDSGDAVAIEDLATAWATCRPAVLKAMTERAVGRIRASAARRFADAFRLRRKKEDEDG